MNKNRKRRLILTLLVLSLLMQAIVIISGFYLFAKNRYDLEIQSHVVSVAELFRSEWMNEARLFSHLIDILKEDPCIQSAFAAKDRKRLQVCTKSLYSELNAKFVTVQFFKNK